MRAFLTSPWFLELVRQFMRWVGVWLMTIGVPESLAGMTSHEDAVMGVVGFCIYLTADGGWLASKWKQVRTWWAKRRRARR
jgi:hypothetical protein